MLMPSIFGENLVDDFFANAQANSSRVSSSSAGRWE